MKRATFVLAFMAVALSVSAQDWLLGGSVYYDNYSWDNSNTSESFSQYGISLSFGKYLTSAFALRAKASFNGDDDGDYMSFGAFLIYDAIRFERVTLAITGNFLYGIYNDSYKWNDTYSAIDANRININIAPQFVFSVSKNLDLYWEFFRVGYIYTWLTLPNYNVECNTNEFYISGPFTNPTFGITFRF